MKYNLYLNNLKASKSLEKYLEEKINKIELIQKKIIHFDIELAKDSKQKSGEIYKAEANLEIPGHLLRVVEHNYDIHIAIDKMRDKLLRQIKRKKPEHKGKATVRRLKTE